MCLYLLSLFLFFLDYGISHAMYIYIVGDVGKLVMWTIFLVYDVRRSPRIVWILVEIIEKNLMMLIIR